MMVIEQPNTEREFTHRRWTYTDFEQGVTVVAVDGEIDNLRDHFRPLTHHTLDGSDLRELILEPLSTFKKSELKVKVLDSFPALGRLVREYKDDENEELNTKFKPEFVEKIDIEIDLPSSARPNAFQNSRVPFVISSPDPQVLPPIVANIVIIVPFENLMGKPDIQDPSNPVNLVVYRNHMKEFRVQMAEIVRQKSKYNPSSDKWKEIDIAESELADQMLVCSERIEELVPIVGRLVIDEIGKRFGIWTKES